MPLFYSPLSEKSADSVLRSQTTSWQGRLFRTAEEAAFGGFRMEGRVLQANMSGCERPTKKAKMDTRAALIRGLPEKHQQLLEVSLDEPRLLEMMSKALLKKDSLCGMSCLVGEIPLEEAVRSIVAFKTTLKPEPPVVPGLVEVFACASKLPLDKTLLFDYVAVYPTATAAMLQACAAKPDRLKQGVILCRILTSNEFLFTVEPCESGKGLHHWRVHSLEHKGLKLGASEAVLPAQYNFVLGTLSCSQQVSNPVANLRANHLSAEQNKEALLTNLYKEEQDHAQKLEHVRFQIRALLEMPDAPGM